jgi:predicted enzyme related to lactoylglutathione lyase
VPEPKTVKNRVHLDLLVGPQAHDAEVERLVALGATVVGVHDGDEGRWTLLTDPEGNEFDVS